MFPTRIPVQSELRVQREINGECSLKTFYRCDEVRSHFGSRQIIFAPRASASAGLVRARVGLAMSGAVHSWESWKAAIGARTLK